jgi:hypothetical protein
MLVHNPLGLVLVIYILSFLKFRYTLGNNILLGPIAIGNYVLNILGSSLLVVFYLFFNKIKELANILFFKLKLFIFKRAFLLDLR